MADSRVSHTPSYFAPSERASLEEVRGMAAYLLENPVSNAILESVAGFALILNEERQVVAANREFLSELGLTSAASLYGLRLGEVLRCIHVRDQPGGCGTAQPCARCGNALAIMGSLELGSGVSQECGMTFRREGALQPAEYQARSTPVRLGGHNLLVFTLQDISGQKRREALEHIFFHDILNLVEGLDGIACRLMEKPVSSECTAGQIKDLACQLGEEIQSQRILLKAEEGCLVADHRETRPVEVLEKVRNVFAQNEVAEGRRLEIHLGPGGSFPTDPVLLTRVLVNMVKNALEATPKGGTVRVWHEWREGRRGFVVENPGLIPPGVAERIFQRSYSTKAARGRGLGTYGARLLGEQFLGGKVGFTSQGDSTRFFIWIPDHGPVPRSEGEQLAAVALEAEGQDPAQAEPEGDDTVLVIDDSRTVRRLLSNILAKHYRVLLAEDGKEGLTLAAEHDPDLILLDVMMPELDGFEVCARLKADSRTRDIPVLFLTALSGEVDEMRALEAGGIDFIPKPISPAVLAARVRNHLELKHYQDRLRNLSLMDGLTGIANRRRFDQYLELEWQRCSRTGHPLSVVMGDVDFFKAYNDAYGHGQGDECLRRVGEIFAQALRRPADLAARYGGEEFVCILPETDREGARIVAEQILAQLELLAIPHVHSSIAPRVTVSLGVATAFQPSPARPWKSLVEEADRLLYVAKGKGRNRIEGL